MNKKNESHGSSEKVIYSTLGGGIILAMCPQWIPACIFGGGFNKCLWNIRYN